MKFNHDHSTTADIHACRFFWKTHFEINLERDKARPGCDADHSPPSSAEVKYE
jgi:hypothetical protein